MKYSDKFKKKICKEYLRGGITQVELWEKYGVSPSTISRWLGRYRQGDRKKFVRIAQKERKGEK